MELFPPASDFRTIKQLGDKNKNVWLCLPRDVERKPHPEDHLVMMKYETKLSNSASQAQQQLSTLSELVKVASSKFESGHQPPIDEKIPNPFQTPMQDIFHILLDINKWLPSLGETVSESDRQIMLEHAQILSDSWNELQDYMDTELHNDELFNEIAKVLREISDTATRLLETLLYWRNIRINHPRGKFRPGELFSQLQAVKMYSSTKTLKREIEISCHIGSHIKLEKNHKNNSGCPHPPLSLGSENIGPLFMCHRTTDSPSTSWICSKPVFGATMQELLTRCKGPIPRGFIYQVLIKLFDVLSFLESIGVTHREITPENILLNPYPLGKKLLGGNGLSNIEVLLINFDQSEVQDSEEIKQNTKDIVDALNIVLALIQKYHDHKPKVTLSERLESMQSVYVRSDSFAPSNSRPKLQPRSRLNAASQSGRFTLAPPPTQVQFNPQVQARIRPLARAQEVEIPRVDWQLLRLEIEIRNLIKNHNSVRLGEAKMRWYEEAGQVWQRFKNREVPKWMYDCLFDHKRVIGEKELRKVANRVKVLRFDKKIEEFRRLVGEGI